MINYTDDFESVWRDYPKRSGGNSKAKAFKAFKARLKQGYELKDIKNGVMRYLQYCLVTSKLSTEYVMMAATFFGGDEHFLEEWPLPALETKNESWQEEERRLGTQARIGESLDAYKQRMSQTRG